MKRVAKPGCTASSSSANNRLINHNQENQEQTPFALTKQIGQADYISGWHDDRILLEHNPNISKPKKKQLSLSSNQNDISTAIDHNIVNSHARTSHKRRRTPKKPLTASQALIAHTHNTHSNINIDMDINMNMNMNIEGEYCNQFTQANECGSNMALKYEMSNIELLKFQAKHLADDQVTNYRLPSFSNHQSQMLHNPQCIYDIKQDITNNSSNYRSAQLNTSQLYSVGRKLRTQSTKRKKESTVSQNSNSALWVNSINSHNNNHNNSNSNSNSNNMYKTLTKQWISALNRKNPHLIIESFSALNEGQLSVNVSYPHSCAASMHKQKQKDKHSQTVLNSNPNSNKNTLDADQQQYPRAIHYKKYRPFTKYFQCKRNKHNELGSHKGAHQCSTSTNANNINNNNALAHGAGNLMKKVEGRKLYQLLSLNRQVIRIQDL